LVILLTQTSIQVSLEPEQQKALLQQVMNLTPEQINSLPLEQRQQVLDLQQAYRNQII
jgi:cleavage stimulation factor subunit 2